MSDFGRENPWEDVGSRSMENALMLAERTGHIARRSDMDCEKIVDQTRKKRPSLKLISLLREITAKRTEHAEVTLEIQRRMEDKETRDITHLNVLEQKVKDINALNSYLQNIINNKEVLVKRLQQPFEGEYIKLEATYHKYASELFPQVAQTLADLSAHIDNVDWAASTVLTTDQFDVQLNQLTMALSKMQTHVQSLCKLRAGLERVCTPSEELSPNW